MKVISMVLLSLLFSAIMTGWLAPKMQQSLSNCKIDSNNSVYTNKRFRNYVPLIL